MALFVVAMFALLTGHPAVAVLAILCMLGRVA